MVCFIKRSHKDENYVYLLYRAQLKSLRKFTVHILTFFFQLGKITKIKNNEF